MEPRFGHSFTNVRVHADTRAAASARTVNAQAYTVGQHVVFDAGRGSVSGPAGRALLAHELAHVVQQSRGVNNAGAEHERAADRASEAIVAGHAVPGVGSARLSIQRQEKEADAPHPGLAQSAALRVAGMLGFDSTQSRIVAAALTGMVTEIVHELGAGGKGALFLSHLASFSSGDVPKVIGGYILGLAEGLVSPLTDLFGLAVFGEQMNHLTQSLAVSAFERRAELLADVEGVLGELGTLGGAFGQSVARIRENPKAFLIALLNLPDMLAQQAESKAYDVGKQGGTAIVSALNAPWEPAKESEKGPGAGLDTPLTWLQEKARSAEASLIETPWAKIGNKLGYAVGFAVITIVLFAFTEGIGNLITEAGAALGAVSKSLGVLARGAEGLAAVLKSVGGAIAAVEKLIALGIGKLLKPLESVLEPLLRPFEALLGRLRTFLRELFGVVEKESQQAATKAAAVLADDAGKALHPPPGPVHAPPAAPLAPAAPHAPPTHQSPPHVPAAEAPRAPAAHQPAPHATTPHPAEPTPLPAARPAAHEPASLTGAGHTAPTHAPGEVLAEKPAAGGHHVKATTEGIEECSTPPCPILRRMYRKELNENPRLSEQLDHAERNRFVDPEGSAAEAADVQKELQRMRREARSTDRSRVSTHERDVGRGLGVEEHAARRELEADVTRRLPEGTKVKTVYTESTEAGHAQGRAAARPGEALNPDIEYQIDLPDDVRRRAGLPARDPAKPSKGTFKPDDIRFFGSQGERFMFVDNKYVGALWEESYFSSAAARPKIRAMLERDLHIAEALQPRCVGFAYTTNDHDLANLLTKEIIEMRIRFPSAKELLHAPGF